MSRSSPTDVVARSIQVRGVVQGVGFRPFVFKLAHLHAVHGWVLNADDGVRIHAQGHRRAVEAFVTALGAHPPAAAQIAAIDVRAGEVTALTGFEIRRSVSERQPTTRVAPDLPVCAECLHELFEAGGRRRGYPYINCTNCGPRYSIVRALPYDRALTTMAGYRMCSDCAGEYGDPMDRRFHAQPLACPACGPRYALVAVDPVPATGGAVGVTPASAPALGDGSAIEQAAALLRDGAIVALKGIGGYHLSCDAENTAAVSRLRDRKYRKDQAFAVMVPDATVAERLVELTAESRALLRATPRPIVLAPARLWWPAVAPDNRDLGVMLPYAPLHHLLFAAGAPPCLVMTSGNRSSEPIAFTDDEARERLSGIADAMLIGERAIARRVDDSVMRAGPLGPMVLRRSRGMAPTPAASLPSADPILAVGGDLKNTITLVVGGQAYVSQHIGDLSHHPARRSFEDAVHDLLAMYDVSLSDLRVVHDAHPEYVSTRHASGMGAAHVIAVQHHRAHVASVLAERGVFDRPVLGVAFDGTGYGDDGSIWGGECFVGSVHQGFTRVAHLQPATLPGGDASARYPVQAAAGWLGDMADLPDLTAPPFCFPDRYRQADAVRRSGVRTFATTSAGRLFDTAAALLGFTREVSFEGQAAMWLEHLARGADDGAGPELPMTFDGTIIDPRPGLRALVEARRDGTAAAPLARAFHRALAQVTAAAIRRLAGEAGVTTVVLSGGVMQNVLLLHDLQHALAASTLQLWVNHSVPPNDGGLSLGQAALALRPRA